MTEVDSRGEASSSTVLASDPRAPLPSHASAETPPGGESASAAVDPAPTAPRPVVDLASARFARAIFSTIAIALFVTSATLLVGFGSPRRFVVEVRQKVTSGELAQEVIAILGARWLSEVEGMDSAPTRGPGSDVAATPTPPSSRRPAARGPIPAVEQRFGEVAYARPAASGATWRRGTVRLVVAGTQSFLEWTEETTIVENPLLGLDSDELRARRRAVLVEHLDAEVSRRFAAAGGRSARALRASRSLAGDPALGDASQEPAVDGLENSMISPRAARSGGAR